MYLSVGLDVYANKSCYILILVLILHIIISTLVVYSMYSRLLFSILQ
jgi:hypothetical protein